MPKIRQSFGSKETLEIRYRGEVGREIAQSLTTDPRIVAGNTTVRTRTARGTGPWGDVCLIIDDSDFETPETERIAHAVNLPWKMLVMNCNFQK